jgi:hypothetical protein
VRALHDPAPGAPVGTALLELDLLAARADVRRQAVAEDELRDRRDVIAGVEAEVLGPRGGRRRALDRDRVERALQELLVVAVGALGREPDRDAPGLAEKRALRPLFALSV